MLCTASSSVTHHDNNRNGHNIAGWSPGSLVDRFNGSLYVSYTPGPCAPHRTVHAHPRAADRASLLTSTSLYFMPPPPHPMFSRLEPNRKHTLPTIPPPTTTHHHAHTQRCLRAASFPRLARSWSRPTRSPPIPFPKHTLSELQPPNVQAKGLFNPVAANTPPNPT